MSGDSCASIIEKFGTFTLSQFQTWNPAVGKNCAGLFLGYYYCIAVPGTPNTRISVTPASTPTPKVLGPQPQQPGTSKKCTRYYLVKAGDSCFDIEQNQKISAADFNSCSNPPPFFLKAYPSFPSPSPLFLINSIFQ